MYLMCFGGSLVDYIRVLDYRGKCKRVGVSHMEPMVQPNQKEEENISRESLIINQLLSLLSEKKILKKKD